MTKIKSSVAIIDYGLGNLFSIQHACINAGVQGVITSSGDDIVAAGAIILPGVGSFGDAMNALKRLDLIAPLKEVAASNKPLIGICLGMQLLMTESYEFGIHQGLDIIKGVVVPFEDVTGLSGRKLKVPQVGWNRIYRWGNQLQSWSASPLHGLQDGEFMYFVHSYYAKPENPDVYLTTTQYGNVEFCSALQRDNIFACQFHPERSGAKGLQIYRNIASLIQKQEV